MTESEFHQRADQLMSAIDEAILDSDAADQAGVECDIDGAILTLEFASTAGHGVFEAYFPDGTIVSYGRQQIDRRANRVVLPIQAKARIAAPYRAAFDYHCRLDMPADPIAPAARAECVF